MLFASATVMIGTINVRTPVRRMGEMVRRVRANLELFLKVTSVPEKEIGKHRQYGPPRHWQHISVYTLRLGKKLFNGEIDVDFAPQGNRRTVGEEVRDIPTVLAE
jgi:hypothetical protein